MHDRKNPAIQRLTAPVLNVFSLVYKTAAFFQWKLRSRRPRIFPSLFIVSIDNLAFGGTGKTPLIIHIGADLTRLGQPFSIVSRGYRSRLEKTGAVVQPDHESADVGDEACLLKRRFPEAEVIIGRDRIASLQKAERSGRRFVLLDDGFQSAHIAKDFRIMLVNPGQPFYFLRHFPFLASATDLLMVLGGSPFKSRDVRAEPYSFRISGFHRFDGTPVPAPESGIFAFSALGDNTRFISDLQSFGLKGTRAFSDHHRFSKAELDELEAARRRSGAGCLVCSEKDFVRLDSGSLHDYPFLYSRNEIQLKLDITRLIMEHAKKKGFIPDLD